jgi:cold shock CspA family protein/ribosome-associated translation inhibitor RaiA
LTSVNEFPARSGFADPMQMEPHISFQNLDRSDAVETDIRRRIEHLEQFHPRLIGCRVVVDAPHRGKQKGKIYEVRIDLSVPGQDIAVTREAGVNHAHEDIYVTIRDAFNAAQRLLEDRVRKLDAHRSKRHPMVHHGRLVRIFDEDGYGFIEAEDGHEVYFDRDSMTKEFWPKLKVGSRLRFKEQEGDKGPFGIQVTLLD